MKKIKKLFSKNTNQKISENSFLKVSRKRISLNTFKSFAIPYSILLCLLVVLPIIIILIYSLIRATGNNLQFAATFIHYIDFFSNSSFVSALFKSILLALIATIISVIISYPVAYVMAFSKSDFAVRNVLILITLPIWTNMLIRMIGLRIFYSIFGSNFYGSLTSIVMSMIYLYLPYVILPLYNSLAKLDKTLIEASKDLGANSVTTFWKITFRRAIPGVISGVTLMLLAASTSLIVTWRSGGNNPLIANIIQTTFLKGSDFSFGAAISVILGVIILIIIAILKLLGRWVEGKSSTPKKMINNSDFKL